MSHDHLRDVDTVRDELLEDVRPLPPVRRGLDAAGGRVLAEDVAAPTALPPESRAAMDGVAVRSDDVERAAEGQPVRLPVDGASLAGQGDVRALRTGTAREIATGAPLPVGADAIVRVEELRRAGGTVEVSRPVPPGRDVRPAGQDATAEGVLVSAGVVLGAAGLGGLAGAGVSTVAVVPAPRVVVVPTGDEVVAGTTPDAVGPALEHLLVHDGAMVDVADPVPDDPEVITAAIERLAAGHDLVVTVGGVSVGHRDHAGDLVGRLAVGHHVSLAMRPGRPFAWGRTGDGTTVVCLPGTPLAALAASILLVRPVVARLAGLPPPLPRQLPVVEGLPRDPARRCLHAAQVVDGRVRPVPGHGAADLARMAATTALIDLPPGRAGVEVGDPVDVWPLP